MVASCVKCAVKLTPQNWSEGFRRIGRKVCIDCWTAGRQKKDAEAMRQEATPVKVRLDTGALLEELKRKRGLYDSAITALEQIEAEVA